MKCALYGRVSLRDRQDFENQLVQLREFAKATGWTVFEEYTDEESGRRSGRRGFLKLFEDASRHRFDVVLFWSLDRFSREGALETLSHLRRLTTYGVNFRSFTQPYLDSCGIFREAIIALLAVVAKQEAVVISERTKAGLQRARKNGKRLGRPPADFDVKKFSRALADAASLADLARRFKVSKTTAARWKHRLAKAH